MEKRLQYLEKETLKEDSSSKKLGLSILFFSLLFPVYICIGILIKPRRILI